MNDLLKKQLEMLKAIPHKVDGIEMYEYPASFNKVIFQKHNFIIKSVQYYEFADYMIKPFNGFDFNIKFNNGVNVPLKYMSGKILKETEKMYYLECEAIQLDVVSKLCSHCLKNELSNYICDKCGKELDLKNVKWKGWVSKKSIMIKEVQLNPTGKLLPE